MSVKVMGMVWDADLPRNQKMVLLAYADHADHDGRNVFPSVGRVAWKTGYSERAVQQITRELEEAGILVPDGDGPSGTNRFFIAIDTLPQREEYGGAKTSPPEDSAPGGVKNGADGGADSAPKPSVNNRHREPSPTGGRVGEIFRRAEVQFGGLNATMNDMIQSDIDDYGMLAVEYALGEAEKNGANRWEYVTAICKRRHGEATGARASPDGKGERDALKDRVQAYAQGRIDYEDLNPRAHQIVNKMGGEANVKGYGDDLFRIEFYKAYNKVVNNA